MAYSQSQDGVIFPSNSLSFLNTAGDFLSSWISEYLQFNVEDGTKECFTGVLQDRTLAMVSIAVGSTDAIHLVF